MVRIYDWREDADHSAFLDALHAHGLKLMATFYMGDSKESPVRTPEQRGDRRSLCVAGALHAARALASHCRPEARWLARPVVLEERAAAFLFLGAAVQEPLSASLLVVWQ